MSYGPYKEFVIDGANIICPLCMQMNDNVMSIPIRSALTLKSTDCVSVNIQHQRVCTEYDKMIMVSSPCICTKDNLPCKPIVTDWINRRGSVANVKANKHIMLLDDATIKCSRGNAMLSFVNSGQKSSVPVPDDGFISMPSTMRESGFLSGTHGMLDISLLITKVMITYPPLLCYLLMGLDGVKKHRQWAL